MGKNQAYKAMQRAKMGSTSAGPDDIEDGMVDGSFHSPEWHAARLASLKTSHTVTWEEFKKKQKEDEMKKGELEADKGKMMRDYRAQLDAERASKLAHGRNHFNTKSDTKKDRKYKDVKKRSSKKRKLHSRRRSYSSVSSSSDNDEDDVDDNDDHSNVEKESRRSKSKSKMRKHQHPLLKERKDGPVPLSQFFGKT